MMMVIHFARGWNVVNRLAGYYVAAMTNHAHAAARTVASPPADLCLAFANTRYWRGTDNPTEELTSLDALWSWCESRCGSAALIRRMKDLAGHDGTLAQGWFDEAIALREVIARLFRAVAEGVAPGSGDLGALDRALATAPARSRIARGEAGYAWRVDKAEPAITTLLAPVLWSAADILTSAHIERARRCGNDRCLWLFLDDSKSGNRRWCSMSACGNREKAHRHRLRHKGAAE